MEQKAAYLRLTKAEFKQRIEQADKLLERCVLCPQQCMVNRRAGERGKCRSGLLPIVSSFNPHHGEEPPISGNQGSGTIFFTNCNLQCCFCQNYPISQLGHGNEVSIKELAQIMIYLQKQGCHNINLVSPSHFVPQVIEALGTAINQGLEIPIVYNSGGYDSPVELKLLEGIVDIYMPDMKYADRELAVKYSAAPDYPKINRRAILEMYRQVGTLKLDEDDVAYRGLLIRHLVLPHNIAGTEQILKFIARQVSPKTHISLMGQYFPAYKATTYPQLKRRITTEEYRQAIDIAKQLGLDNVWLQERFRE